MNKTHKILIAIALILLVAGLLKPDIPKEFYSRLMGEYAEKEQILIAEKEELKEEIRLDSINHERVMSKLVEDFNNKLEEANDRYNWLNSQYKKNEKELDKYRNSSFDDKFKLFSDAVIGKDSVQGI